MAEVLQVPRALDGQSFYQSSGLRRSHPSSSSLFLDSPALSTSPRNQPSPPPHAEHNERISLSPASSSPSSSPQTSSFDFSSFDTKSSTPASSGISLEQKYGGVDDMDFPDYGGVQFYQQTEDFDASQSSDEPVESTTSDTTRSDSPLPTPTVQDDTAIKQQPKQHVDYLSHEWREEDIWSSWRHIVSQRRVYGQRSRLENASWRTWAKSKYHLRTVSPETLNWLKESDVTWLYGPLKPADSHPITSNYSEPTSRLSKNNSFVNKKPILKKRSMSEVMLQKSLSTSSLVQQAAAAVQAQRVKPSRRAPFHRAQSDFVSSSSQSEAPSRDQVDYFTSRSSSDNGTPCECKDTRHIRFDDKVEQCIAVECKEGDFDEQSDSEPEEEQHHDPSSDSSSDDGVLIMKRKKRPGFRKGAGGKGSGKNSRSSSHNGRKTIETLPATTLKYRTDSPDVSSEAQQHHTFGRDWDAATRPRISPSPSQETLRPSHPSKNFLLGGKKEDEGEPNTDSSWSFGASNPKSSLGAASSSDDELPPEATKWRRRDSVAIHRARNGTPAPSREEADDYMAAAAAEGLRRTNSGMLMPYDGDEDEDDMMAVGLFGRVSETINTARDIAHVIWNVGWRK
ncbi:hypothetical protein LTR85_008501 [Meristemomyces frigidus]|nr:hypothetical protein LTR85_008501 [Meristemomyces frigidus]